MSARKAPSAAEVAEFTSPAVNESETDKLLRKSRDQPFVPLGKYTAISQYFLFWSVTL